MPSPLIKPVLTFLLALLLAWGAWHAYQNRIAPSVTFTTLGGEKIAMAKLKKQVVLVHFWSINCLSCMKEMPDLVKFYQHYHRQGLQLIAVAMAYDPPSQVLHYTQQTKLPFPVMHDGYGEMSAAFGDVTVTPSHFLYNKQGRLLQRTIGTLDLNKLAPLLERELAKPD